MAQPVHLQKDSARGEKPEAEPLPKLAQGQPAQRFEIEQRNDQRGCGKTDGSGQSRMEPTVAARDEGSLDNGDGFDEREAQRPKDGRQRQNANGFKMSLLLRVGGHEGYQLTGTLSFVPKRFL
jgi:hypothetical protein